MADLVIGGRRPSGPRTMRAVVIAGVLIAAAFIAAWYIYRRAVSYDVPDGTVAGAPLVVHQAAPGAAPQLRFGDASLTWVGGLAVLRVHGDPHTVGGAHGRLLGRSVVEVSRPFAPTIDQSVDRGGFLGRLTRGMRIAWRHRFIDDGIPEDHRRGLAGVVRGAAVTGAELSYSDLLRYHAALGVGVPVDWTDEAQLRQVARSLTFVVPQGSSLPGRLWIGRSLALPGIGDGGDAAAAHPVISFVRPEGRIAWVGVGWPGLVGVVTGINAEGLVVTVHPARTRDVRPTRAAIPGVLLARDVLETCKTLDEAIAHVDKTPTLGALALVVVDGKNGAWAVLERTPSRAAVLRTPAEPAVGDALSAPAFLDDPDNDRARRVLPTMMRLKRLTRLARTPPADAAAAAALLRDDRAPDDVPLPPGHRGAIDDLAAVQVVLIDPAAMALWVADGDAGARFRAFDLRHELRGEGDRAAPPADIPADIDVDPTLTAATHAARADLRDARRALSGGSPGRAEELVQRALARAPRLPEALELAGAISRARGNRSAMSAYWHRWIDNGPDDPGAEEEIRAILEP